ncbi:MAG: ATP synthase F1 subunit delta [Bryobacteraceae bacterium]|nr:ATP synthase F1 subunit delta [Bryobacteraceae bacterium]
MSLAVASRYANALADVVIGSKGVLDPQAAVSQLRSLSTLIQGSAELKNIFLSPAVASRDKSSVVARIAATLEMSNLIRNFVQLVVRNRRANLLPQILTSFEKVLDERAGMAKVEISSAWQLNDTARAGLEAELARFTGKQVRCNYSVDPALIGGVVARIGSLVYDGSVRGQLEILRRRLSA